MAGDHPSDDRAIFPCFVERNTDRKEATDIQGSLIKFGEKFSSDVLDADENDEQNNGRRGTYRGNGEARDEGDSLCVFPLEPCIYWIMPLQRAGIFRFKMFAVDYRHEHRNRREGENHRPRDRIGKRVCHWGKELPFDALERKNREIGKDDDGD